MVEAVEVLPQASTALIEKVRMSVHPLAMSALVVTVTVAPPVQLPFAVIKALMLAQVGRTDGLQPRFVLAGTPTSVGAVVSTVQVQVVAAVEVLPQASTALIEKVRVTRQPLMASALVVTVIVAPPAQLPLAVIRALMLAQVGRTVGLHPRFVLAGTPTSVGAVVSTVQV